MDNKQEIKVEIKKYIEKARMEYILHTGKY